MKYQQKKKQFSEKAFTANNKVIVTNCSMSKLRFADCQEFKIAYVKNKANDF